MPSVAVIGGGPSGLALAKCLAEENFFSEIDIYERQDQTGGVWNFSSDKPQTASHVPSDDPTNNELLETDSFSAMYRDLETNLIHELMEYKGVAFPTGTIDYPHRTEVLSYVKSYQETLPRNKGIRLIFNTIVEDLDKREDRWILCYKDRKTGEEGIRSYDYTVVCAGHYEFPYIPQVPGLTEWWEKDPMAILHAKNYVDCEPFLGKKVLVIGNNASGIDIATQISETAQRPVLMSGRRDAPNKLPETKSVLSVKQVVRYDYDTRSATFIDGTVIDKIDKVVFCTGYLYAYPFLKSFLTRTKGTRDALLDSHGSRTRRLYKQIFYIPDPTIAFVALLKNVVPMPLAECQGSVIARVFSGRLKLPDETDMRDYEQKELENCQSESDYHTFPFPKDVDYYQHMIDWSDQATNPENGFRAQDWDSRKRDLRGQAATLKQRRLAENLKLIDKRRRDRGLDD